MVFSSFKYDLQFLKPDTNLNSFKSSETTVQPIVKILDLKNDFHDLKIEELSSDLINFMLKITDHFGYEVESSEMPKEVMLNKFASLDLQTENLILKEINLLKLLYSLKQHL